jgi:hypothetical protein
MSRAALRKKQREDELAREKSLSQTQAPVEAPVDAPVEAPVEAPEPVMLEITETYNTEQSHQPDLNTILEPTDEKNTIT